MYVDDLLIARSTNARITHFKDKMKALFDMIDLGLLKSYLSIQVKPVNGEITLSQSTFALKILFDFILQDCNNRVDSSTYRSLTGSLWHLTHTRPYLMFYIGYLSRYMEDPSMYHFVSAKQVLRYVKGIVNFSFKNKRGRKLSFVVYCDIDYGGDSDDQKSTSGAFLFFGENIVTWIS